MSEERTNVDSLHCLVRETFNHVGGSPTVCVRCKLADSAEGYYESGASSFGGGPCRIGICREHKRHGGAKIVWYANDKGED